jgi:hypothetical protein
MIPSPGGKFVRISYNLPLQFYVYLILPGAHRAFAPDGIQLAQSPFTFSLLLAVSNGRGECRFNARIESSGLQADDYHN